MWKRPLYRGTRGHNLLETILASILFAVISVALLGIWGMQARAMHKSKNVLLAAFVAERTMEECVAAGFDRVEDLYPQPPVPNVININTRSNTGSAAIEFTTSVTVGAHPTDSTNQKTVEVRVDFTDSTGDRSVSYHTALSRQG